jgi:hypothetical protein
MTLLRRTALPFVAVFGLMLAGCSPTSDPTPTATSTPSPTPTPTAAPPSPEPPAAREVTCENVLTEAEYASLVDDGLELRGDTSYLGPVMSELASAGALTCHWVRPSSDVQAWYAELPVDEAAWADRRAALEASGWAQSDDPLPGTMLAPADYDSDFHPSILWTDGTLRFASYARLLGSVAALQ